MVVKSESSPRELYGSGINCTAILRQNKVTWWQKTDQQRIQQQEKATTRMGIGSSAFRNGCLNWSWIFLNSCNY
jgi:hypothetical protein